MCTPPSLLHTILTTENGDLYTWGKAGPHLGYCLEDTKQLRPRKVDAMVYGRVQAVACGNQHTVGQSEAAQTYVQCAHNCYVAVTALHSPLCCITVKF